MRTPDAIAWIDPDCAQQVTDAIRRAGLTIAAIGSPTRGLSAQLAQANHSEPMTDLRTALAATSPALALLAATPAPLEPRILNAADARGLRLASTGPVAESLAKLAQTGMLKEQAGARPADLVHLVPRIRDHPAFKAAADLLEHLGPPRLLTIESCCPPSAGGLRAALFSAIDTTIALAPTPELVDASIHPALPEPAPGGHVAALLRFPDGRAGQLTAASAGPWAWRVTLLANGGRLTIRPSGFDWFDPHGNRRDQHRADPALAEYTQTLALAIAELTDPNRRREPPPDWITLHSIADAAALSARTGEPESPATISRATMTNPG